MRLGLGLELKNRVSVPDREEISFLMVRMKFEDET